MILPGARLIGTGSGVGPPGVSDGRESTCSVGDVGSMHGSGRSPGGEHGNPSSILAGRIPWTGEPGGLQSIGLQRVGHDWATKHAGVQGTEGEMRAGKVSEGPGGGGAGCLLPGWADLCRGAATGRVFCVVVP